MSKVKHIATTPVLRQDGPGWYTPTPPLEACTFAIVLGNGGGRMEVAEQPRECREYGHAYEMTLRWNGEELEAMRCKRCGSSRFISGRPVTFGERCGLVEEQNTDKPGLGNGSVVVMEG